jgi:hypothetical protein
MVKIIATTGHLMTTAAWLGGLLTVAAILVPSTHLEVLHDVLPRFPIIATRRLNQYYGRLRRVPGTSHTSGLPGVARPLAPRPWCVTSPRMQRPERDFQRLGHRLGVAWLSAHATPRGGSTSRTPSGPTLSPAVKWTPAAGDWTSGGRRREYLVHGEADDGHSDR